MATTLNVLLGTRVYPFSGVGRAKEPTQIRVQIDSGGWSALTGAGYTDILSEAKLYSQVHDVFGTVVYELEVTDEDGVDTIEVDVVTGVRAGRSKNVYVDLKCVPFFDFGVSNDPAEIASISYSVSGDATVAKTAIDRKTSISGEHDGSSGSASLLASNVDFTELMIRVDKDIVRNITDGSEGVITAVADGELTATLAGGTDDDWDTNDVFNIVDGSDLDIIAKRFTYTFTSKGMYRVTLYVEDQSSNEASATITVFVQDEFNL